MKCDQCGAESELGMFFKTSLQSASKRQHTVCVACETLVPKREWIVVWIFLTLAIPGVVCVYAFPSTLLGPMLINLALFELASFISVTVHELGHAITAWICRLRVFLINVGRGNILLQFRGLGAEWLLRGIPGGGFVYAGGMSPFAFRTRESLCTLGGPLANGLLLWFALSHTSWDEGLDGTLWEHVRPATILAILNVLYLLGSLSPIRMYPPAKNEPRLDNDIRVLWKMLRMTPEAINKQIVTHALLDADNLRKQQRLGEALEMTRAGLKLCPDHFRLKLQEACLLEMLKRYPEARQIYMGMLESAPQDAYHKAVILNALAFLVLLEGDATRLEEADHQSEQALIAKPDDIYFRGTRGGVLIELGRIDEGQIMLAATMGEPQPAEEKALNAVYIAIAQEKLGRSKTASEAFEFARRLDPRCPLLAREKPVRELTSMHRTPSASITLD